VSDRLSDRTRQPVAIEPLGEQVIVRSSLHHLLCDLCVLVGANHQHRYCRCNLLNALQTGDD
jgi:hypothetical protein